MDLYKDYLLRFRDLKLTRQELIALLPKGFVVDDPIVIYSNHLIHLITKYRNNDIDKLALLDWVNTVWFSEWFTYNDEQCDCIATIMNELEEIDEKGNELTEDKIQKYLHALENNLEV